MSSVAVLRDFQGLATRSRSCPGLGLGSVLGLGWTQPFCEPRSGLDTPEVSSHQTCWDAMKIMCQDHGSSLTRAPRLHWKRAEKPWFGAKTSLGSSYFPQVISVAWGDRRPHCSEPNLHGAGTENPCWERLGKHER